MSVQRDPEGIETAYLHEFGALAGARVLEIGCGAGRLTWRYAAAARRVTGIEPDIERVRLASRECPAGLRPIVTFALARSEALPFPRETFDRAILAWSL
ncbi:MAG: class I SAM-dependent methyltransferase [Chloroflexi bacterium]|nr:class I SAM-dependent methyltransferase [Chloroflexota bacterium]